MERRDELEELLTDQDAETLRHLVNEGMGANPARTDLGSRLSGGLGIGGDRKVAALAGAGSAAFEIRRPSPLGPAVARDRPRSRHACRRRRKSSKPGLSEIRRSARAIDGAPAAGQLVRLLASGA